MITHIRVWHLMLRPLKYIHRIRKDNDRFIVVRLRQLVYAVVSLDDLFKLVRLEQEEKTKEALKREG